MRAPAAGTVANASQMVWREERGSIEVPVNAMSMESPHTEKAAVSHRFTQVILRRLVIQQITNQEPSLKIIAGWPEGMGIEGVIMGNG